MKKEGDRKEEQGRAGKVEIKQRRAREKKREREKTKGE